MAPSARGRKRPIVGVSTRNSKRAKNSNSQETINEVVGDIVIETQQIQTANLQNDSNAQITGENSSSGSNTAGNTIVTQAIQSQASQLINQGPITTILNNPELVALQARNQQLQAIIAEQQRQLQPLLNTLSEASSSGSTHSDAFRLNDSISAYLNPKMAFQAVHEFTNTSKGVSVSDFIKTCKEMNSKIHPNQHANFFCVVKSKITGSARNLIEEDLDNITNLDQLLTLLKERFINSDDFDNSREASRALKQEQNETVHQYGSRVSEKLAKALNIARQTASTLEIAGQLAILKSDAIKGFTSGLKDKFVKRLLVDNKPKTLHEAIQRARNNEDTGGSSGNTQGSGTIGRASVNAISVRCDKKCHNCFKTGHILRDCFSKGKCHFCKKANHIGLKCFVHNTCFSCGKKGHLDKDCRSKVKDKSHHDNQRNKNVVCRHCDKPGHYESTCWIKKREEKQGGNSNSTGHLNSKGAPRHQGQRSNVFVANGNASESSMKCKETNCSHCHE